MKNTLSTLLLVMLILLACACTGTQDGEGGQGEPAAMTSEHKTALPGAEETAYGEAERLAETQSDEASEAEIELRDDAPAGDDSEPVAIDLNNPKLWQIDGFYFRMPVADAMDNIVLPEEYICEVWQREDYTGMVLVGADEEQLGYRGSLMFLEGTLVAVIKYKREVVGMFEQLTNGWAAVMGVPETTPPEFTHGYEFMSRMQADERAPEYPFYWANEELGVLLLAGYDELERLSTYMLIDVERYDELALLLADLEP